MKEYLGYIIVGVELLWKIISGFFECLFYYLNILK